MDNISKNSSFINLVREYLKIRLELYALRVTGKVAETLSRFMTAVILLLLVLITVIFLSISAAYFIGYTLNNTGLGFLVVGGFYVFLVFLTLLFKGKFIRKPMENSIINLITGRIK